MQGLEKGYLRSRALLSIFNFIKIVWISEISKEKWLTIFAKEVFLTILKDESINVKQTLSANH